MSKRRIAVASVSDVAPNSAHRVEADGHRIAIVRLDDEFFAIGDQCSHADYSLAEGEIDRAECAIECWKHGSLFSLVDGSPLTLPATRPVPVYTVEVDGDAIYVIVEEGS